MNQRNHGYLCARRRDRHNPFRIFLGSDQSSYAVAVDKAAQDAESTADKQQSLPHPVTTVTVNGGKSVSALLTVLNAGKCCRLHWGGRSSCW
jgi:hypothetical protein